MELGGLVEDAVNGRRSGVTNDFTSALWYAKESRPTLYTLDSRELYNVCIWPCVPYSVIINRRFQPEATRRLIGMVKNELIHNQTPILIACVKRSLVIKSASSFWHPSHAVLAPFRRFSYKITPWARLNGAPLAKNDNTFAGITSGEDIGWVWLVKMWHWSKLC